MHNPVNCNAQRSLSRNIFSASFLLHLTNEALGSSDLKLDSNISISMCSWGPLYYGLTKKDLLINDTSRDW